MTCVIECDGMTATSCAQPSHAVRQTRWRQPYLCVTEAFANFAENPIAPHPDVMKFNFSMTAGRVAIEGIEYSLDRKAGRIHVNQQHRGAEIVPVGVFGPRHHDIKRGPGRTGD